MDTCSTIEAVSTSGQKIQFDHTAMLSVRRPNKLCRRGSSRHCPGGDTGRRSGVGVLPGAGAGRAGVSYSGGVGANLGGPVNRV